MQHPPTDCPLRPWKWKYESYEEAFKAFWRLKINDASGYVELKHSNVEPFKCQSSVCGGWHVGQKSGYSLERK